ncbi:unnamed protein product [Cuscuta epithymum]|uniref:Uncharacterized protein n=1 Tax=Cuscuta epithymum TaxID=186058 RepID=A0AAV0CA35_9ASTE|nr:unnamed protein product [Cuscuta epithymum]CAH9139000.1 unnamed protein product [Cuscuta epithymum]
MGRISAPSDAPIKSEDESLDALWQEQQEGVPLKQRLKLLLAGSRTLIPETEIAVVSEPSHNIYVRSYSNHCYSEEEKIACFEVQQNDTGEGDESMCQLIADNNIILGKVDVANSLQQMSPSHLAVIKKVSDTNLQKQCIKFSSGADMKTTEMIKSEIPSDFLDDLDFVVLKERQRMLLSRKALSLERKTMKDNSVALSSFSEDDLINEGPGLRKRNDESRDKDGGHSKTYDLLNFRDHGLTESCSKEYSFNQATSERVQGNGFLCSLKKVLSESSHELDLPSDSLCTGIVDVKVKPLDSIELDTRGKHATDSPLDIFSLPIKGEAPYDSSIDELDHTSLRERLELFSRNVNAICSSGGDAISASLIKIVPPMVNHAIPDRVKGNDLLGSLKKVLSEHESSHELDLPSDSLCADIVEVKVEPLESIELDTRGKHATDNPLYNFSLPVKREEVPYDSSIDELDHMSLRERLQLFSRNANGICSSGGDGIAVSLIKTVPPMVEPTPISSATAKPVKIQISRKRRKTATDSVELAMEEDAPGLLKALLEKGVAVHEIKLYGEPESNEPLDDLSTEDSFAELEEIIIKLFSRHHSLLKLPAMHSFKGEKASYCLACLFSLVEQAQHLRLRKWPVEWGWCRDLQSFIFVFERHNRIVLERPEYGYATYFFELVGSIPIHWQIRRLITAMKLTSCSRVLLIENRAILVGEDVSEGEARVLVGYGWTPNTGLGSMLNYCDRVVHDRKQQERDSSEWRTKIGKMLIDGYNGGRIVPIELPGSLAKYNVADDTNVKLELD